MNKGREDKSRADINETELYATMRVLASWAGHQHTLISTAIFFVTVNRSTIFAFVATMIANVSPFITTIRVAPSAGLKPILLGTRNAIMAAVALRKKALDPWTKIGLSREEF